MLFFRCFIGHGHEESLRQDIYIRALPIARLLRYAMLRIRHYAATRVALSYDARQSAITPLSRLMSRARRARCIRAMSVSAREIFAVILLRHFAITLLLPLRRARYDSDMMRHAARLILRHYISQLFA